MFVLRQCFTVLLDQELISCRCSSCFCSSCSSKSRRYKSDRDDIWQECSSTINTRRLTESDFWFDVTLSVFRDGGHDVISRRHATKWTLSGKLKPSAYAAASVSSWSIVHLYLFFLSFYDISEFCFCFAIVYCIDFWYAAFLLRQDFLPCIFL